MFLWKVLGVFPLFSPCLLGHLETLRVERKGMGTGQNDTEQDTVRWSWD